MKEVAIIGVGMHQCGRFMEKGLKELGCVATWNAIHDANIDARDIGAAYVSNGLAGLITGQEGIRGQIILGHAGISGIPIVNVEGACASGVIALREAAIAVGAGVCDVALALGVEKMYSGNTSIAIKAISSDADIDTGSSMGLQFTALYAMNLRKLMDKYGWTQEDFAMVTVKNKYHGSLNPNAQFQTPVTIEEVLNSRLIADPLTLLMCSAIGDGAAAAIVCSKEVAHKYARKPLVTIEATQLRTPSFRDPRHKIDVVQKSPPYLQEGLPYKDLYAQADVAREAYERAGIGPEDIEVAEVHDAMSPAEMMRCVALGFYKAEDAPAWIREGCSSLTGKLPVNPSGGLGARGHPIGATGLAQVSEMVWQLRGEAGQRQVPGRGGKGPKVALIQNSGGYGPSGTAALTVTILKR
ncbi:thiolase family protein [Chloroflexota bacterium]